jgi:trans-aconitate methyltransferase
MSRLPFNEIAAFYDRRVVEFGHDPRACDYGRAASQQRKFEVLSRALNYSGLSVLDVGCGFADYADFLAARFSGVTYSGIDLSSEMIVKARALHPSLDLKVGNLIEQTECPDYDVISANGIFYRLGEDAPLLMRDLVTAMFRRCRKAVTFNTLSLWAPQQELGEFYADPAEVLSWCRQLTPWVVLRHDYMPHDFTIYLYREQVRSE